MKAIHFTPDVSFSLRIFLTLAARSESVAPPVITRGEFNEEIAIGNW
jgi:hypothetical protein